MGYPGSVQTFTTKQDGVDYPQAADINGPQTEITAIETGLLGGFQHPISVQVGGITQSASTGSNNFAGPSSFAGTVSVTGNSTFAGDVTIGGGLTVTGLLNVAVPRVSVTASAAMGVPSGAFTGLNWDVTSYDNANMHSTSVNSSRLTFRDSTGIYQVGAQLEWPTNSSGFVALRFRLNDVTSIGGNGHMSNGAGGTEPLNASVDVRITSTADYVTVSAFQTSGSTRSIATSNYGVSFWAHKVSA